MPLRGRDVRHGVAVGGPERCDVRKARLVVFALVPMFGS